MTANDVHADLSTNDQYNGSMELQSCLSSAFDHTDAQMTKSVMDGAAGIQWWGRTDNCNTSQPVEHIA